MIQTLWLDAHLSPALAPWITNTFDISTHALRDVGLRDAEDLEIFEAARTQSAALMTKDRDFVELVERLAATAHYLANLWQHIQCKTARGLIDNLAHCMGIAKAG